MRPFSLLSVAVGCPGQPQSQYLIQLIFHIPVFSQYFFSTRQETSFGTHTGTTHTGTNSVIVPIFLCLSPLRLLLTQGYPGHADRLRHLHLHRRTSPGPGGWLVGGEPGP